MKYVVIMAAVSSLSLFMLVGCDSGPAVPGAVKISEADMKTKIVGSWQQESSELEQELRLAAERDGMLQTEQGKNDVEENLKTAYRKYEFKSDGTYRKDFNENYGLKEESGTWEMTRNLNRPEQLGLFLSYRKDAKSYSDVHYLEGDKIMLQYGGDDDIHTLTRIK
ncbi:MAG: DUF5004 domain-containing protein [Planctomycetota bacterium]